MSKKTITLWMRRASFWTQLVGFGFFVFGDVGAALTIRIFTEAIRLPTFYETRMRDQVCLCYVVILGCFYGLWRIR